MSEGACLLSRNGSFFRTYERSRFKSFDIPISPLFCVVPFVFWFTPWFRHPLITQKGPRFPRIHTWRRSVGPFTFMDPALCGGRRDRHEQMAPWSSHRGDCVKKIHRGTRTKLFRTSHALARRGWQRDVAQRGG